MFGHGGPNNRVCVAFSLSPGSHFHKTMSMSPTRCSLGLHHFHSRYLVPVSIIKGCPCDQSLPGRFVLRAWEYLCPWRSSYPMTDRCGSINTPLSCPDGDDSQEGPTLCLASLWGSKKVIFDGTYFIFCPCMASFPPAPGPLSHSSHVSWEYIQISSWSLRDPTQNPLKDLSRGLGISVVLVELSLINTFLFVCVSKRLPKGFSYYA